MVHKLPELQKITEKCRSESFSSFGNSSSSNNSIQIDEDEGRKQNLAEENERLRLEMYDLKAQVQRLQDQLEEQQKKQQQQQRRHHHHHHHNCTKKGKGNKKKKQPGVLIELPATLQQAARAAAAVASSRNNGGSPLNCCSKRSKEERSLSTSDGQETVEPNFDFESHESLGGLHQRNALHNHQNQTKKQSGGSIISGGGTPIKKYPIIPNRSSPMNNSGSPRTRKTDPMSQDSLSTSDYEYDDESSSCCEHHHHIEDDGYEEDIESQLLLPPHHRHQHQAQTEVPDTADEYSTNNNNFYRLVSDRAGWLVGLLVLQSMSSFILARNEALLQRHLVIIRFLTMLVGAGGNAGNQASVRVIRGLAIGAITDANTKSVLWREVYMGLCLSLVLGVAGCIRAAVFLTPMLETLAITASLFMIVMISIVLGAMMPIGMKMIGIDPAHSSTTIQVVMDILGVMITVQVSSMVLDSGFRHWIKNFGGMMDA